MNRVAHPVRALFLVVALLVLLRTPLRAADDKSPKVYAPVVNATNHFAVKFFKAAYEESPQKNVITAPASLSYAFALLLNGVQREGRDQIADVFDFKNIPLDQINRGNAALRGIRTPHPVKKPDRLHPYPGGLVGEDGLSYQPYLLAGGLWKRESTTPQFTAMNAAHYGYTRHQERPSAASINRWAALVTHGKMTSIAPEDISREDFVLATIVYFKSAWKSPFLTNLTHPGEFTLLSGEKKQAQMMVKREHDFQYLKGPNFQAVKLNFHDAAMFIVLPDEGSTLQAFVNSLTPETWDQWLHVFRPHEGHLELPRFDIEQERDIKPVLEKIGVIVPFDLNRLETFEPMVGSVGGCLTRVLEGTSVRVDETGAEIKSYGIVGGVLGGITANPPAPFHMIVNRPFFFAVIDTRTDQTLFMGTVVEP